MLKVRRKKEEEKEAKKAKATITRESSKNGRLIIKKRNKKNNGYDNDNSSSNGNGRKEQPVRYALMFCNSENTKKQYLRQLQGFFDYIGLEGAEEEKEEEDIEQQGQAFLDKARQDRDWATEQIMSYLIEHKQRVAREEITAITLRDMRFPIKSFTEAHRDVGDTIDWRRIIKAMPKTKSYSESDRIPTLEELRKLVEYPDRRIKAIVYTMCSSGIRKGSWKFMKWKHVQPIYHDDNEKTIIATTATGGSNNNKEEGKEVKAAKLLAFDEKGQRWYTTFMTPEAFKALDDYRKFCRLYGEEASDESSVLLKSFRTADMKRDNNNNNAQSNNKKGGSNQRRRSKPESAGQLKQSSLERMLERALYEQGIRHTLEKGKRRHEFKALHSFRKYFKTHCEQASMIYANVEELLGHRTGLDGSYRRPTEEQLLESYLKVVPALTINDTNITTLKAQQQALEQRQSEKDKRIELLEKELAQVKQQSSKVIEESIIQFQEGARANQQNSKMLEHVKQILERVDKERAEDRNKIQKLSQSLEKMKAKEKEKEKELEKSKT